MSVSRLLSLFLGAAALSLSAQTTVPTVGRSIPAQTLAPNGATAALNLVDYFSVPGVTGQIVQFDTVMGKFEVAMRADVAPQNVANFLGYVQRGDYSNSFFHRSAVMDASGAIGIVQGGGYVLTSQGVANIPTQSPAPLEYNLPNSRGTLAAARTTDINSATSQWYFNVRDNSSALNQSNGGGYTVFGQVLGTGMTVVDAIAALPQVNASGGDPNSPFQQLPVRNYTSGNVQPANLVVVNSITAVSLFPSGSGGASAVTFSVQSSAPNVVTPALTGSILALTPGAAGNATVTVTATDVNGNTASTSFNVTVAAVPPTFTQQPASQTIAAGSTVVFSAPATAALTYQWRRDGVDIAGATNATFVINNTSASNNGTYSVVAGNSVGSITSNGATLSVVNAAPGDVGRLANLSIRSNAGSGNETLIVGFSLGGSGTSGATPLLVRAIGPSLSQFGVSGVLQDPVLALYSGNNVVASNDNWGGNGTVSSWGSQVQAFGLAANSLDAALAQSLNVGGYTANVTGNGGATGTALAEIYDATPAGAVTASTPRLINVSARTQVGTGGNILIAGFVVTGTTSKTLLIRASGPALASLFGVGGTLADPKLQVLALGSSTVITENNDWAGDPQVAAAAARVSAFPYPSGSSKDAAVLVTLPPGSYSAQVSGADGGTGVAMVEVYEVP